MARRGEIALFVLTKIAMLFFILALALILTSASGVFKASLCEGQAQLEAERISSILTQVINSPLEDERRVYAFEPILSIGSDDLARYEINITNFQQDPAYPTSCPSGAGTTSGGCTGFLQVLVQTSRQECGAGSPAPYKDFKIQLFSTASNMVDTNSLHRAAAGAGVLTIQPSRSDIEVSGDCQPGGCRSKYLVVIKCKKKSFPADNYLFVEDCRSANPESCLKFSSTTSDSSADLKSICEVQVT